MEQSILEIDIPFKRENYLTELKQNFKHFYSIHEEMQDLFLRASHLQSRIDYLNGKYYNLSFDEVNTVMEKGLDYNGRNKKASEYFERLNYKFIRAIVADYNGFYKIRIPDIIQNVILNTLLDDTFIHSVNPDSILSLMDNLTKDDKLYYIAVALIRHLLIIYNKEVYVRECGNSRDLDHITRTKIKYENDRWSFTWDEMKQLIEFIGDYHIIKYDNKSLLEYFHYETYSETQKFKFFKDGLDLINSEKVKCLTKEIEWKKGNLYW
jgi:hypothetical protein